MNGIRLSSRKFLIVGSVLLTVALLAACMPIQPVAEISAQPAQEEDMEAVVNEIWREYESSLIAGDVDRWAEQWAEDGVQMPPGQVPRVGKAEIKSKVGEALAAYQYTEFVITNQEVEAADGWGYARGLYTGTFVPKAGGEEVTIDGKYMTILQKQSDGTWKIYRDFFNSNVP